VSYGPPQMLSTSTGISIEEVSKAPDVDRVLEPLQRELKPVMGNCGTQKVADINRNYVTSHWKI